MRINFIWDQMKSSSGKSVCVTNSPTRTLPKLMFWLILFVSATCLIFTLKFASNSSSCGDENFGKISHKSISSPFTESNSTDLSSFLIQNETLLAKTPELERKTEVQDIVFGIAASAELWGKRKNYIKLWWKPEKMRGIVWLDSPVKTFENEGLPQLKISGKTNGFAYKHRQGNRSAIRIARIVSETLRLGMENVRWFVMGDDDTVFVTENLVRVLNKYDHNQYYYIGSVSESHLQNIHFSYGMAYGGGGFAISYPLAKALEKMQDECIQRYPKLYGSDERIQACMAELGVPLTKELGFHQYDVYGNLFGLLSAHPVTPLVTLHHLDLVEPIFPNVTRIEALQRLTIPMKIDSAGLLQQSICYEKRKTWTISVSWGFTIQIFRGILSPREIEMPSRTFLSWYKRADYTGFPFNTRPVARNPCQKPFVFYLSRARLDSVTNQTVSIYDRYQESHPDCNWKMLSPGNIDKVVVYKRPDPHLWDRSPRRNCGRILESKRRSLILDVGVCREDEYAEL